MPLAGLFRKALYLLHKGVDVLKFAVYRGESDVGNYVGLLESCEHHLANVFGLDLGDYRVLQLGLDGHSNALRIYGALLARALYAEDNLVLIEELTPAVSLNNGDGHGIDYLISGEAFSAAGTFASALYARSVVYGSGVENP